MKIVHISTGYDISSFGGITNYVRNLSETLVKMGQEVFVIYSQDDGTLKNYKFQTIPVKTSLFPFYKKSVVFNGDIKKIEKIIISLKPDIIHTHMMIDLPIGVLEMFKKHAKLVISLHDYSFICKRIVLYKKKLDEICTESHENRDCDFCIERYETSTNRFDARYRLIIKNLFYKNKIYPSSLHYNRFVTGKVYFNQADALIAVSDRVKEIYEKNGYVNENFLINHIGNYTAEDEFRANFVDKKNIEPGKRIKFGFLGNLHKVKGLDIFIEIASRSRHEFHIYGEIEGENFIKRIKQVSNIYYHGTYNHSDLISILKEIEIGLVLPIWEDNAPQVVFEFLNAGIPIIGTRMGGLPDFINETNGRLFNPTPEEINGIINFIGSDDIYSFYNKLVNKISGTKKSMQHGEEMLQLYKSILNK